GVAPLAGGPAIHAAPSHRTRPAPRAGPTHPAPQAYPTHPAHQAYPTHPAHPAYLTHQAYPTHPAYRCSSHASRGSVPLMNASVITLGHRGPASLPVSASMSMNVMPSGTSNGTLARPASAVRMNYVQIGSAARAPLSPTGRLSSKPTQTTVSSSGVKPANHASRRSLVVPVLPAASSVKPIDRAAAAVPSFSTLRIMFVTRNVVSGRATGRSSLDSFFVTSLPPRVT